MTKIEMSEKLFPARRSVHDIYERLADALWGGARNGDDCRVVREALQVLTPTDLVRLLELRGYDVQVSPRGRPRKVSW